MITIQDWFGPVSLKITVFQFTVGLFCIILVWIWFWDKLFTAVCRWFAWRIHREKPPNHPATEKE